MAESTLSVDLQELRKHAAYFSGYQRPFSEGTVLIKTDTSASTSGSIGVSTVEFDGTSGTDTKYLLRWPSWSAGATFIHGGNKYKVNSLTLPPRLPGGIRNYARPSGLPDALHSGYFLTLEARVDSGNLTNQSYELVPWDDRQFEDIDSAVEGGLRRFYYPYIESEGQIYQWSFLRKEATTGAVSASDSSVALADDVAHIVDDSVVAYTVAGA